MNGPTRLPMTYYAVGITYNHRHKPNVYVLAVRIVEVSGRNPLTDEEAHARARRLVIESWDAAAFGSLADYEFGCATSSRLEVG